MIQITRVSVAPSYREQFIELRRIVADSIGPGDENLPTLFRKGPSFGDGNDNTQADRRRCGFIS
jgi:hypothetical protein